MFSREWRNYWNTCVYYMETSVTTFSINDMHFDVGVRWTDSQGKEQKVIFLRNASHKAAIDNICGHMNTKMKWIKEYDELEAETEYYYEPLEETDCDSCPLACGDSPEDCESCKHRHHHPAF
jgi:hypothetical protein